MKNALKKLMIMATTMTLAIGLVACGGTDTGKGNANSNTTNQNQNAGTESTEEKYVEKVYENVVKSGEIEGSMLKWTVTSDKTLYIHGLGDMPAFELEVSSGGMGKNHAPWRIEHETGGIEHIVVEEGVTSIGDAAFTGMEKVKTAKLANTIKRIGEYAFHTCTEMTEVNIPTSLTSLGTTAFRDCFKITEVTIPGSVESIPDYCFFGCWDLKKVVIEDGVKSIGNHAFWPQGGSLGDEVQIYVPDSVVDIHPTPGIGKGTAIVHGNTNAYVDKFCAVYGYTFASEGTYDGKVTITTNASPVKETDAYVDFDGVKLPLVITWPEFQKFVADNNWQFEDLDDFPNDKGRTSGYGTVITNCGKVNVNFMADKDGKGSVLRGVTLYCNYVNDKVSISGINNDTTVLELEQVLEFKEGTDSGRTYYLDKYLYVSLMDYDLNEGRAHVSISRELMKNREN